MGADKNRTKVAENHWRSIHAVKAGRAREQEGEEESPAQDEAAEGQLRADGLLDRREGILNSTTTTCFDLCTAYIGSWITSQFHKLPISAPSHYYANDKCHVHLIHSLFRNTNMIS